jgi:hypothetical protein
MRVSRRFLWFVAAAAGAAFAATGPAKCGTIGGPGGTSIHIDPYRTHSRDDDRQSRRERDDSGRSHSSVNYEYGGPGPIDPLTDVVNEIIHEIQARLDAIEKRRQQRILGRAREQAERERINAILPVLRAVLAREIGALRQRALVDLSIATAHYLSDELAAQTRNLYRLEYAIDEATRLRCDRRACNQFVITAARLYGIQELSFSQLAHDIHCLVEGPRRGENCGSIVRSQNWEEKSGLEAARLASVGQFVIAEVDGHVVMVAPVEDEKELLHHGHPIPLVRGESLNNAYWIDHKPNHLAYGIDKPGCRASFDNRSATSAACHFSMAGTVNQLPKYFRYTGPLVAPADPRTLPRSP